MNRVIVFNGTLRQLRHALAQLPSILSGSASDSFGVAKLLQLRIGVALLMQVQLDFITKSRGGTGRDGIKWPPLKPETIAYNRRVTRKEDKDNGVNRKKPRPSLDSEQDGQWRAIFYITYRRLLYDVGDKTAKRIAAGHAWAEMKRRGARTLLMLYGKRQVDMLRDTGLLFKSLSPGVDATPSNAEGQVFRLEPGKVIVGTNQKPWHHTGTKTIPARRLWPEDGVIPPAWRPAINRAGTQGVFVAILYIIGGGTS